MAMNAKLRNRAGTDIATIDLGTRNEYPEVIISGGVTYVIKRILPDKQSAFYYEANIFTVEA
jgi:hypothetical protein